MGAVPSQGETREFCAGDALVIPAHTVFHLCVPGQEPFEAMAILPVGAYAPAFENEHASFLGPAAPSRGSTENCAWRLSGSMTVTMGGETLTAGHRALGTLTPE